MTVRSAGNRSSVPIDWPRIESFVGYGRADAPVVFIGPEEHLDSVEGLSDELRLRSTYDRYMDRRNALASSPSEDLLGKFVRTWKPMNDLMLRRGSGAKPTYEKRREYQIEALGTQTGDALLTELLPYPSPDRYGWVYGTISRFLHRTEYEDALTSSRVEMLKKILASHRRELVVCYSKHDWCTFERLFPGARWGDVGSHLRVATYGSTRVLLTTHFSRGFQSESSLDTLATVALGEWPARPTEA